MAHHVCFECVYYDEMCVLKNMKGEKMSVYSVRGNPNYSAEAIRVDQILEYSGMDRLVGIPFAGNVSLVPKGKYKVGDTVR